MIYGGAAPLASASAGLRLQGAKALPRVASYVHVGPATTVGADGSAEPAVHDHAPDGRAGAGRPIVAAQRPGLSPGHPRPAAGRWAHAARARRRADRQAGPARL